MTLTNLSEWFAPPIFRRQIEARFWFVQLKHKRIVLHSDRHAERVTSGFMSKCISEELEQRLLQKLWIDVEVRLSHLDLPIYRGALFWKIVRHFRAEILHKICRSVRHEIRFYLSQVRRKLLQHETQLRNHLA